MRGGRGVSGEVLILLLPLRWGLGGIVGGLRRTDQCFEPRLQGRDAGVLRGDPVLLGRDLLQRRRQPRGQRRDRRVLIGVAQAGVVRERGHPISKLDSGVTVSRVICGPPRVIG